MLLDLISRRLPVGRAEPVEPRPTYLLNKERGGANETKKI